MKRKSLSNHSHQKKHSFEKVRDKRGEILTRSEPRRDYKIIVRNRRQSVLVIRYVLCTVALDASVDYLAALGRGLEGVESYGALRDAQTHSSAVAKTVRGIRICKTASLSMKSVTNSCKDRYFKQRKKKTDSLCCTVSHSQSQRCC